MAHIDEAKRAAGRHAVDSHVKNGMRIGMGTGSTAVWAIRRIGELLKDGALADIVGVATSYQAEFECERLGISLRRLNDPAIDGRLDLVIDGADEIDPNGHLTKGGGGALLFEKILAYAADSVIIVADEQKLVERLGLGFPIPVEIAAEARLSVLRRVRDLGGRGELRWAKRKMGPVITDNGNPILDVTFKEEFDPIAMEQDLDVIPGAFANGIFAAIAPVLYVGKEDGSVRRVEIPSRS